MDVLDLLLTPLYLGLFYFLALRFVSKKGDNALYRTYYIKGIVYKFGATLFFTFIYLFYYKGGDSIAFYYTISPTYKLFFSNTGEFFRFVTGIQQHYPVECMYEADTHGVMYLLRGSPTLTTIRIGAVLNLLGFNSYIVLCLWFAYISYQFQWKAFKLVASVYPTLHKQLAYAFLMIPSVLFWGSGVGKDSIMLGAILLLFYCFYNAVILRRSILKYVFIMLVTMYIISLIRSFILYAAVPCLFVMAAIYYQNSIKNGVVKFLIGPVLVVTAIAVSYLFVQSIGDAVDSYSVESLQQKAEGFKTWHSYLGETQGGSSYSLGGEMEYNASGILKMAPMAVIITLFGPFIWDVHNVVILLSAIESTFFLLFTLSVVLNRRMYKILNVLFKDHILMFCLPLVLILSIAIGLTSFNYGALVRYKIPVLPFFSALLIIVNYHLKKGSSGIDGVVKQ